MKSAFRIALLASLASLLPGAVLAATFWMTFDDVVMVETAQYPGGPSGPYSLSGSAYFENIDVTTELTASSLQISGMVDYTVPRTGFSTGTAGTFYTFGSELLTDTTQFRIYNLDLSFEPAIFAAIAAMTPGSTIDFPVARGVEVLAFVSSSGSSVFERLARLQDDSKVQITLAAVPLPAGLPLLLASLGGLALLRRRT